MKNNKEKYSAPVAEIISLENLNEKIVTVSTNINSDGGTRVFASWLLG